MRFPEFGGEWKECKLGDVTSEANEKVKTKQLTKENYVSTENILQDFNGITIASSLPQTQYVTAFKFDDILLSNIRPYLRKIWKANIIGGCSSDVFVIRGNQFCLPDFLYYSIANNNFVSYVMQGAKGVKMPRGDKKQIMQYSICIPSIEEQKKISTLLFLIDERITTQNKIIEKLESLIKGLNNYLHSECEEIISLSDLGYSYSGLSGKTADDFGDGKPYITYLNVYQNNVINNKNLGYVRIEEYENQNLVKYGDALFTLSSETPKEVGIASVCLTEINDTHLNSFCFGYRLSDFNTLLPQYMPFCFSSERFRRFILQIGRAHV